GKEKDREDKKGTEKKKSHLSESEKPLNVIVVADTDFMADLFWVQTQDLFGQKVIVPTANNADFIVNAADNLSGTSSLIKLRSRGLSARPFELVQKIQNEAENKFRAKERSLVGELEEAEKKIQELQTNKRAKGAAVLSPEQESEINNFRARVMEIRRELRRVQLDLRRDIDNLDSQLKFINIAAMPIGVTLVAIVVALVLRNRKRGRAAG
ncbi:MAG: ABC transporter, partial [Pseudomonadota bacterium]|nr:ABC transporter [Pseudomonadota bacterium]